MSLKIQIQLKKIPKYATLEKILGQELPLFEAGDIEVTTGHFFLMLPVNAAMFSLSSFKLTAHGLYLKGGMWLYCSSQVWVK